MGQADLPTAKALALAKTFALFGWSVAQKRGKGSHMVLIKKGMRPLTLPTSGDVKRALLWGQIKQAGIDPDRFTEAHRTGKLK